MKQQNLLCTVFLLSVVTGSHVGLLLPGSSMLLCSQSCTSTIHRWLYIDLVPVWPLSPVTQAHFTISFGFYDPMHVWMLLCYKDLQCDSDDILYFHPSWMLVKLCLHFFLIFFSNKKLFCFVFFAVPLIIVNSIAIILLLLFGWRSMGEMETQEKSCQQKLLLQSLLEHTYLSWLTLDLTKKPESANKTRVPIYLIFLNVALIVLLQKDQIIRSQIEIHLIADCW